MRTPFELQNDFIEFLQVLYAPYCYSREKESIARTLRDYLDAHYTEEISLNDLARQYSYSPSHLIRSFHQAYGASPMQYLKKLRIEHASQLLLHSDATIQSVGEMVGLRIPSYFIRVFKQEIGITPANLSILKNNKAKAVRFSTLEALCRALDCQPGDILEFVPDEDR